MLAPILAVLVVETVALGIVVALLVMPGDKLGDTWVTRHLIQGLGWT